MPQAPYSDALQACSGNDYFFHGHLNLHCTHRCTEQPGLRPIYSIPHIPVDIQIRLVASTVVIITLASKINLTIRASEFYPPYQPGQPTQNNPSELEEQGSSIKNAEMVTDVQGYE